MRAIFVSIAAAFVLTACGQPPPAAPAATASDTPALAPGVAVSAAWANPTPHGVDISAGYLTIANGGPNDDRLVMVASPRAAKVDIHEMTMDGAMGMRPMLNGLPLPAGQTVTLAPNGNHLMFSGVTQPFVAGEHVPITLTFAHASPIETTLEVRAP